MATEQGRGFESANNQEAEPILVLHLESPNRGGQGDSIYRTVQPCRAMAQRPNTQVVTGSFLNPLVHELLPLADVLVLCDVVEADLLPVMAQRRARGLCTIYEVNDDFQALQSWNPTAYLAANPISRSLSSQLANVSDGVQFSTPYLAQRFAHLHERTAVLPNALWQLPAPTAKPEGIRVGWGGSLGHKQDFLALMPVMARVLERFPEITFEVMGAEVFREMCEAALPKARWRHRKGGTLEAYYEFLSPLHVGLCPLQDTDFNLGRSDVKFLEYAAHGVVAVACNLPPYQNSIKHGETGLLFDALAEIEDHLALLLAEPSLRARMANNAREYVQTNRLEAVQVERRWAFVERCLDAARATASEPVPPGREQTIKRLLKSAPRPFRDSPLLALPVGKLEQTLLEGLSAARDGETAAAVSAFRTATARAPKFYLPWLYLGSVEPDPSHALRALHCAEDLQPASVAAPLLQADKFLLLGQPDKSRTCLRVADELAPLLGVPAARLAESAEAQGQLADALALEARALRDNPYYAAPHVRRALTLIEQGRPTDALASLLHCLKHDDRFWMTRFALGRLQLALEKPDLALAHLQVALTSAPDQGPVLAQLARAAMAMGQVDEARRWLEAAKAPRG